MILATGAAPKSLPGVALDGTRVISSDDALRLDRLPASVIVIGAGAVGVEFADVFAAYGVQVTVVEALPRLLPIEDEEISKLLARSFAKRKIEVRAGAKVQAVKPGRHGMTVEIEQEGQAARLEAAVVLMAVGPRRPDAGPRPRAPRGRDGPRLREGVPADGDVRARALRHRGRGRPSAARPQGERRGDRGGRGDRRPRGPAGRLPGDPELHLLSPPGRQPRAHRGAGPRGRAAGQGREVHVPRERQGAGARGAGGSREDRRGRRHRRDPRRAHPRAPRRPSSSPSSGSGRRSRRPSRRWRTRSTPTRRWPRR